MAQVNFINVDDIHPDTYRPIGTTDESPVLVNLMDLQGKEEQRLLAWLKTHHPHSKCIAIHCYTVERMVQETLQRGYTAYVSVFNFSREIEDLVL